MHFYKTHYLWIKLELFSYVFAFNECWQQSLRLLSSLYIWLFLNYVGFPLIINLKIEKDL